MINRSNNDVTWATGVWFSQATPKFFFITWLAMQNHLSTMDTVARLNQGVDTSCILCNNSSESRDHLFFECIYSSHVREFLTKGILQSAYTTQWNEIKLIITDKSHREVKHFCLRYALQGAIYAVWRKRNKIRHGDSHMSWQVLQKMVEKNVRNKLSLMTKCASKKLEGILSFWFRNREKIS